MSDWSDGYVSSLQYTTNFYRELAPSYLSFACLLEGMRPPPSGAGTSYLELGCGQGFGVSLLAAANPQMRFVGVDFMPAHIANARRLASESGLTNVQFEDLSFDQLLSRIGDEERRFEFIVLHGVYTWISPANRKLIVQLADRLLQPGGLLYVSYNCLPGWAPLTPIQRFIQEFAARNPGNPVQQVEGAVKAAKALFAKGDNYFARNKTAMGMLDQVQKQNPRYLVHEYLPAEWSPVYHADVAADFAEARMEFACSATLPDNVIELSVPPHAMKTVAAITDPGWRQTLSDFLGNKQFRRDLFMRGVDRLFPLEWEQLFFETRLALMTPPDDVRLKFRTPLGQVNADETLYKAVVSALADGPRTLGELTALPALKDVTRSGLRQVLALLVGAHYLAPVAGNGEGSDGASARAFNRVVSRRAALGGSFDAVACGLTGTGKPLPFVEILALDAYFGGAEDAAAGVPGAWAGFQKSGRRLLRDGKELDGDEATHREFETLFQSFFERQAPLLRANRAI